jgi:dihydroorotate dehydrogenase (NAD+) catalytic subunit
MVWECFNAVKIPIIGMGGIVDAADAIEFMLAGSTAVQIGTANFADPFVWNKVLAGLRDYLTRHAVSNVTSLVGQIDTSPRKEVHA